ncbi:MAG: hypothetical protein IKM39_02550 [Clostridia bacterium]|nr:hypothetical protein [Clostridia bacterium]
MKKTGKIIGIWIMVLVLSGTIFSPAVNAQELLPDESGLSQMYDQLSEELKDSLETFGVSPQSLWKGEGFSLQGLWESVLSFLTESVKNPVTTLGMVTAILLFCLLFQALCPGKNNAMGGILQFFVGFCITVAFAIPAGYTLSKTVAALEGLGSFMMIFIPAYAGVLLAMGKGLTVTGAGGLVFGYCQVMSYLANNIILPFVSMFQAFSICEAASGGVRLTGLATCVKRIAMWVMGISATAFSGMLCLTGLINGAADSVAQRTTRFFIGNMIPVIGGALSDSMATLQGCFSLLKSGGGVLGLAVVLAFVLPILLEVVLWRMVTIVLVAVSHVLEMPRVTGLLQAVGEGMGLLLGIVLCSVAVYIVSLSVLTLAGG